MHQLERYSMINQQLQTTFIIKMSFYGVNMIIMIISLLVLQRQC